MPAMLGLADFIVIRVPQWVRSKLVPSRSAGAEASIDLRKAESGSERALYFSACMIIGLVCVPLTLNQTGMYRDLETLWRTTIRKNPAAWMAHHNLAILLEAKRKPAQALVHYNEAVSLNPKHVFAMNNAGLLLVKSGDFVRAERFFRRAIEVDPNMAMAHNNLGIALVRQGRLEEAIQSFLAALNINPDYANASSNLLAVRNAIANKPQP
jgi:superkiller protein 3